MKRLLLVMCCVGLLSPGCACNGGSSGGTTGGNGGPNTACTAAGAKVESLYNKQLEANPPKDAELRRLEIALMADNVHMVLVDCQTNAKRFARCIAAATTVDELERDCLIPLDDAGRVEGDRFGKSSR